MLSNAISIAWTSPNTRKGRPPKNRIRIEKTKKEKQNEDQSHQHLRRQSGQSPALLHGSSRLHKEGRLQPGTISLAHGGAVRRSQRRRAATRAQQQPRRQDVSGSALQPEPACHHVFHG